MARLIYGAIMSLDGFVEDARGSFGSIGGAALAGQAIEAGLVDELQLFVVPTIVGGGKPALPDNDVRLDLELAGQRSFANGTVYLEYKLKPRSQGARA